VVALAAPPAAAEQTLTAADFSVETKPAERGYWHASLLGGVTVPTSAMGELYKRGVAANLRIGYTGRSGLGLTISGAYSPLATRSPSLGAESHLVLATATPRFTLGREFLRVWVGAGGGVAIERSSNGTLSRTRAEPLALGEGGAEFHVFSSGGLTLQGNYARSFGDLDAQLVSFLGGLIFTFE